MELALRTCEGNEFHTVADTEEKAQEPALDTTRRLTTCRVQVPIREWSINHF